MACVQTKWYPPEVLVHNSLHILISAAKPITEHLTAFCDSKLMVDWMSAGSQVVKLPIITSILKYIDILWNVTWDWLSSQLDKVGCSHRKTSVVYVDDYIEL